jgi:hypothetical protein
LKDIAHVPVDRSLAHVQLGGNCLVGLSKGDQSENLELARKVGDKPHARLFPSGDYGKEQ